MYKTIVRRSKSATSKNAFDTSGMIDTALIKMKQNIKHIQNVKVTSNEHKKLPYLAIQAVKAMMGVIKELQVYLDQGKRPDFENQKIKDSVKKLKKAYIELKNYHRDMMNKYDLHEKKL